MAQKHDTTEGKRDDIWFVSEDKEWYWKVKDAKLKITVFWGVDYSRCSKSEPVQTLPLLGYVTKHVTEGKLFLNVNKLNTGKITTDILLQGCIYIYIFLF